MSRVRRTRYLAFTCADERTVDVGRLLSGSVELVPVTQTYAASVLTGERHPLSPDELELALGVPEAWTSRDEVLRGRPSGAGERLDCLVRKGVVVTDDPAPEHAELRRRDETLTADRWNPHSALYHFGVRWRNVRVDPGLELDGDETYEELVARADDELRRLGRPPPHFVALPDPGDVVPLPASAAEGPLYDVLLRRKTSRGFDRKRAVGISELATLLAYVWGCQGLAEFGEGVAMVKKTSPSGGGLHPIEVYPLVRDVDGLDAGLYHYNIRDHGLELIERLAAPAVEELVVEFTAGQTYFRDAHVVFAMAARFPRNYWKYPGHPRAYGVILMDAGHLSQTFYLVCTELGLGAFTTAAINGANIEDRLGLDGYREGAILICGCGPPGPAPAGLEPVFAPYER